MAGRTTSARLTVTVLVVLWVNLVRCDGSTSLGPGCDNGKLYLDRDLPQEAVHWDCPASTWSKSNQNHPAVDTVYDPEPARQSCMHKSISYSHAIPNSGAYRPVRAESGEYMYCPPQRWLNNLHRAATVLLYHPCVPVHERLLLSVLARSCLPHYIITPHPQLNTSMPIALVSWGRTLELPTVASSDVCDWLETTTSAGPRIGGAMESRKYNLLLTWSAEQHRQQQSHPEKHSRQMKESLRRCCEQSITSLLNGGMEAELDSNIIKERGQEIKVAAKGRQIRAAMEENVQNGNKRENTVTDVSPGDVQSYSSTLRPSADALQVNRTLSDPSQTNTQNRDQGLASRSTTLLGSDMTETTLATDALGFWAPGPRTSGLMLQTARGTEDTALTNPKPSATIDNFADGIDSEHSHAARPEALALSPNDEVTGSVKRGRKRNDTKEKHTVKNTRADGEMKDNEAIDVKERELEQKQAHSDISTHQKNKKTGFDSVPTSQSESLPQSKHHLNPQPGIYLPSSNDCDGCKGGENCDCNKDPEARATVLNKGFPRTPRTDEAVWAAAALGFLLVLLALSVLHTRLYRHWRTTPSLYWHDPQQDYDSVADVIRRRLRIAKRRRKRGRRQECVLLPSSSSSDEHP